MFPGDIHIYCPRRVKRDREPTSDPTNPPYTSSSSNPAASGSQLATEANRITELPTPTSSYLDALRTKQDPAMSAPYRVRADIGEFRWRLPPPTCPSSSSITPSHAPQMLPIMEPRRETHTASGPPRSFVDAFFIAPWLRTRCLDWPAKCGFTPAPAAGSGSW